MALVVGDGEVCHSQSQCQGVGFGYAYKSEWLRRGIIEMRAFNFFLLFFLRT
jgi:hypothetical protein